MCSSSSSLLLVVVFHASSPPIINYPSWCTAARDCHDRTSWASSIYHICNKRGKSKDITACQWITVSLAPSRCSLSLFPSLSSFWACFLFSLFFFCPFPMFASPLRYYGDSTMRYRISGAGRQALCGLFVCSFRASCPSFPPLFFIILDPRCMRISTSWSSQWFSLLNREFSSFRVGFTKPVFIGISCYHRHYWLYLDEPFFFRLVRFHYGRRRAYSQGQHPRPSPGPASFHPGLQRYAIQHVAACDPRYAVSALP